MSETPRKRRRAMLINDVDQRRLAEGKTPSWLETDSFVVEEPSDSAELSERDRRLLEDIPPHWAPPA